MVYDSKSDRVINYLDVRVSGSSAVPIGKTIAYDFNSDSLVEMSPALIPVGYVGAQLAYDSESDRVILFAGYDFINNKLYDETWVYDYNSNTWTKMDPAVHPGDRNYQNMTYIPSIDRVILFGGDSFRPPVSETWLYDYNTDSWTQVNVVNTPPDLYYGSMVYVSSIDRVILFGGVNAKTGDFLGETWSFNPVSMDWENLAPAVSPGPRAWHAMAYDSRADKVILFGGGAGKDAWTNETWSYDPKTNTWTDLTQGP